MKQVLIDIWAALVYVWHGAPKDPKRYAKEPPEWWHGSRPANVPEADETTVKEGGFAVGYDGQIIYSTGETRAEAKGWKCVGTAGNVTENDYGEMLAHRPKLTNVTLAGQIKPLWKQGKKYREIAALVGCSEQYVKYFAACFERAQRASNVSPIE